MDGNSVVLSPPSDLSGKYKIWYPTRVQLCWKVTGELLFWNDWLWHSRVGNQTLCQPSFCQIWETPSVPPFEGEPSPLREPQVNMDPELCTWSISVSTSEGKAFISHCQHKPHGCWRTSELSCWILFPRCIAMNKSEPHPSIINQLGHFIVSSIP